MKQNNPDSLLDALAGLVKVGHHPSAILMASIVMSLTDMIVSNLAEFSTEEDFNKLFESIGSASNNLINNYLPLRFPNKVDQHIVLCSTLGLLLTGSLPSFKISNGSIIMTIGSEERERKPLSREMDVTGSEGSLDDVMRDILRELGEE